MTFPAKYVITCSNTNISEKSEFMEWKVSLQGRTYAVVRCLSVVSDLVFLIFSNFFRSVELSDHLVSLRKTFSAQYYGSDCTSSCSLLLWLYYMYFKVS